MGMYEELKKLMDENNVQSFVISCDLIEEMTDLEEFYLVNPKKEGLAELIGIYNKIPVITSESMNPSEVYALCRG